LNSDKNINHKQRDDETTGVFFVVGLLLFPVAMYLSPPRIMHNANSPWLPKPVIAIFLLFLLLASAFLQIFFPAIGKIWMVLPVASALLVVYFNSPLIKKLPPFKFSAFPGKHITSLVILALFFTVLQLLPELDLVDLKNDLKKPAADWLQTLPLWQSSIVTFLGIVTVLTVYLMRSPSTISVSRVIILYICYILIVSEIVIIVAFSTHIMNVNRGFFITLICVLLAAVLTDDFIEARYFGEFVNKFFLKTLPKGLNFIFLWLCLLGLPQQIASGYSVYHYNVVYPIPSGEHLVHNLVFTDRDRFDNGHKAAGKLRSLYSKIFLTENWDNLERLSVEIDNNTQIICPNGDDICQLSELSKSRNFKFGPVSDTDIPAFRPILSSWDVFLSALIRQGLITDTDEVIAGFKSNLPNASKGNLPDIFSFHDANFVSLATDVPLFFIPPSFENVEFLLKEDIVPIVLLYLSGRPYWGAIITIDHDNAVVLVRTETSGTADSSIKKIYDSDRVDKYKDEIMSRQVTVLPLEYFQSLFTDTRSPIIVFAGEKDLIALERRFDNKELMEIKKAIGSLHNYQNLPSAGTAANEGPRQSEYADYVNNIAKVKHLLQPRGLDYGLFPNPDNMGLNKSWKERQEEVKEVLQEIDRLPARDRIDISYTLVNDNNVYSNPELFIQLAKKFPDYNNTIACDEAFTIGKQLFLLGHHKESLPYLELSSKRYPFFTSYEIWYHLSLLKNDNHVPKPYSNIKSNGGMWLYYQTLRDIKDGNSKGALKRLEKTIKKDSHNSLANHLLHKYFGTSLDEDYFMAAPEGL